MLTATLVFILSRCCARVAKSIQGCQRTRFARGSSPPTAIWRGSWPEEFSRVILKSCPPISTKPGFLRPTRTPRIPFPATSPRAETPAFCTTASNTEVRSQPALYSDFEPTITNAIFFADNSRHLDLGCKRSYLETSSAVSEEHYFRSAPSYESSLLSRSYRNEAFSARDACMYGGMETESGSGAGDLSDVNNSSAINCNMWATMQPYARYTVEGVPYQPFTAHYASTATVTPVVPHPASTMAPRPQSDLGVYNSASVQRGLPVIPPPSSSSSCSPATLASRDRSDLPALYQSKPGSPLRPFSAYPPQGPVRDPSLQYQVGLNSTGTHWTDS